MAPTPRRDNSTASGRGAGVPRSPRTRSSRCRVPSQRRGASSRIGSVDAGLTAASLDRAMISLAMPFSGLPAWAETLFYIVFVLIVLPHPGPHRQTTNRSTIRPPCGSASCSTGSPWSLGTGRLDPVAIPARDPARRGHGHELPGRPLRPGVDPLAGPDVPQPFTTCVGGTSCTAGRESRLKRAAAKITNGTGISASAASQG